ncbi:hypothetical protein DFJ74DRAFT_648641 [Hyaloraphidium curvatum]|nr:hypothetical protein DFJ74DRAFT_648641 [Hyaloraphidium curvatum]
MTTACVSSMYLRSPWIADDAYMSAAAASCARSVSVSSGLRGLRESWIAHDTSTGDSVYTAAFFGAFWEPNIDDDGFAAETATRGAPLAGAAAAPPAGPAPPLLDLLPIARATVRRERRRGFAWLFAPELTPWSLGMWRPHVMTIKPRRTRSGIRFTDKRARTSGSTTSASLDVAWMPSWAAIRCDRVPDRFTTTETVHPIE